MTEPQVWVLIALFAGMLATVSTLFVRVVRSEIAGLRAQMGAEIGGVRSEISGLRGEMNARFETVNAQFEAVDVRFNHLDRDVAALGRHVFGADQP